MDKIRLLADGMERQEGTVLVVLLNASLKPNTAT